MANDEYDVVAQERSQAYWLMSRLFLRVPDDEHLRELSRDLALADLEGTLAELRREVEAALESPEEAILEFTRQLVTPGKSDVGPMPYESATRVGAAPGHVTARVIALMQDAGFSGISHDAPAPDHIGAQLRFMSLLCYEESKARASGKDAIADRLLAMQKRFLNEHLAAWAPRYCEGLEARTAHGYMKAVARLTRACLLADLVAVDEICTRLGVDIEPGNQPGRSVH
ncbi:MAG TPA: molecular chaperone TorD family protein [Noviherbaspirillum sp.]|uniref:TorD/DmsD family molecular chaperone n=1 Tax=Noviherbaspirillum sp. TaxID=1926288 RepID=UPI002B484E1F|nr:molecular chaperone TorD family protein [Noviherbaspirillum sp.]HJV85281.1 molecular chaperone TorD family protein [Noviherbaspirillum sp.]